MAHRINADNSMPPTGRPSTHGGLRVLLKALASRLLALSLGLAVAVLMGEMVVRALGYEGQQERASRSFDRKYGAVPADSWIFNFNIDQARHSAVELRGRQIPLRKAANERRVLFLGDSATFGAFVPTEQAYPERTQALLQAAQPEANVRTINAGVWGMTTIDEYHLLHDKLLPLAPDVVVVGLFMANDLNFNLGHGRKRLQEQGPSWFDAARTHSALAHFVFLRLLALNQRLRFSVAGSESSRFMDERISLIDAHGLHMLSYPAGELALYLRGPNPLADEAYAVLHDVLLLLRTLGERQGFALHVLLIPTPSSVAGRLAILAHPGILVELRQQGVNIDPRDLDFGQPTRRVLQVCAQLQVPCTDAGPEFKRLGLRAFFPHDEHPTVAGHEALARALVAGLAHARSSR
jgi:lysophospholipase L1-like esterase